MTTAFHKKKSFDIGRKVRFRIKLMDVVDKFTFELPILAVLTKEIPAVVDSHIIVSIKKALPLLNLNKRF